MNSAQVAFQTDLRDEVASQLSTVTNDLTATVTAMATQMTDAGQSRELAANAAMSTLTATAAANTAALTSRMSALDASNTARMTALDSTITASLGSAVASLNQSVTVRHLRHLVDQFSRVSQLSITPSHPPCDTLHFVSMLIGG